MGNSSSAGQYKLMNLKYNKCLDIDNNNLIVNNDNGRNSQLWTLEPAGNGLYLVKSAANGRYAQVVNTSDGEALTLGNTAAGNNNKFRIAASN